MSAQDHPSHVRDFTVWELQTLQNLVSRQFSKLVADVANERTSVRTAKLVEFEALFEKLGGKIP